MALSEEERATLSELERQLATDPVPDRLPAVGYQNQPRPGPVRRMACPRLRHR
jgi:hypothetical protein